MTGLHEEIDPDDIRVAILREARTSMPDLVKRITSNVQGSVQSYAGPATGRRRKLIDLAVTAAVGHYLDTITDPEASGRRVDELFRRMGHGEATEGHDLLAMQAAFRIASHEAWIKIRTFATENNLSGAALGSLGDALFTYIEHLADQTQNGYEAARRALDKDPVLIRGRLLAGLLKGIPMPDIRGLAASAGWPVPASLVVVTLAPGEETPVPPLPDLGQRPLVRADSTTVTIVADADALTKLLKALKPKLDGIHATISWAVPPEQVPDAWRWTRRAVKLLRQGVIPPDPIIRCADHRTQLWLHAEPALRQRMCQELLRPLLAESPNSREILSETLLAWLESRDSAPAIAAKLGVHPQTVRYRWKRINELFGDSLRDPTFVIQVTMILKASVPLWKAGDQSDFERFRTEDGE